MLLSTFLPASLTHAGTINTFEPNVTSEQISTAEKQAVGTAIHTLDDDDYHFNISYSGGVDNDKFTLDGDKLKLAFVPDYLAPADANGDNIYETKVEHFEPVHFTDEFIDYSRAKNSYSNLSPQNEN